MSSRNCGMIATDSTRFFVSVAATVLLLTTRLFQAECQFHSLVRYCLIDADCPLGFRCDLNPGYSILGRIATKTLIRGVCAPEKSSIEGFQSTDSTYRNPEGVFDIPPALFPALPAIQCNNYHRFVALGDFAVITTQGNSNDLYNLTVPTGANLFVHVKEIQTGQQVPGHFSFGCDTLGVFKLKFKVYATDAFHSLQTAVNICPAQINCVETITAGLGMTVQDIQPPSQTPIPRPGPVAQPIYPPLPLTSNIPHPTSSSLSHPLPSHSHSSRDKLQVLCLPYRASVKVGTTKDIILIDNVLVVQGGEGEVVSVMVKDTFTQGAVGSSYVVSCSRAGTQEVSLAVTVVSEGGEFDMAICNMQIICSGNNLPEIECSKKPHASGPVGSKLQLEWNNNVQTALFRVHDQDSDKVNVGVQNVSNGALVWKMEHTCVVPGIKEESVIVTAFDGEGATTQRCPIIFECV